VVFKPAKRDTGGAMKYLLTAMRFVFYALGIYIMVSLMTGYLGFEWKDSKVGGSMWMKKLR